MNTKNLIAVAALTVMAATQAHAQQYTVNGKLAEAEGRKVYLLKIVGGIKADTLANKTIQNGTFSFTGNISEPYPYAVAVEGARPKMFFLESGTTTITGDPKELKIAGGAAQKAYQQYEEAESSIQKKMGELRMQMESQRKDFLNNNTNSVVSAYLLNIPLGYMLAKDQEAIYKQFTDDVKKSEFGKKVRTRIDQMTAVEPGRKAPDFKAATPEGGVKSLAEVVKKGKITMIDFWASWCGPCRAENPNVVRIYNKYNSKGFNIIGVSLDREGEGDKWKEAIKKDGLIWNHVSDLKFWQSDIAQLYNIRSIPATFLLDEKGVIIAKDLRGAELEKKIAELLDK